MRVLLAVLALLAVGAALAATGDAPPAASAAGILWDCREIATETREVISGAGIHTTRGLVVRPSSAVLVNGLDVLFSKTVGGAEPKFYALVQEHPNWPSAGSSVTLHDGSSNKHEWNEVETTASMERADAKSFHLPFPPVELEADKYYSVSYQVLSADTGAPSAQKQIWRQPGLSGTGGSACGTVAGRFNNAIENGAAFGMAIWGHGSVMAQPPPTPIYDIPALIDGLVGAGAEEDLGTGLVGSAIGVGLVGGASVLVGAGLFGLAVGGLVALLVLVAIGVVPGWVLLVLVVGLLVAAYARYALGGNA